MNAIAIFLTLIHASEKEVPTTLVLRGNDVIELVKGQEVRGNSMYAAKFLRHEYRFANYQNLKRFKQNPELYAVQMGGACGRMGRLSGKGAPDRWLVFEKKVYLFASDSCKTAFEKNPSRFVHSEVAEVKQTRREQQEAELLYDSIVKANGGNAMNGKVVTWTHLQPYQSDGSNKIWNSRTAYAGRTSFALWEEWDAGRSFFVRHGKRYADGKPGEVFGLHSTEKNALSLKFARSPVGIIGKMPTPVKLLSEGNGVLMKYGNSVFELEIEKGTQRIKSVRYKDFHNGVWSRVSVEYSNHVNLNGLILPASERTKIDDKEWSKPVTFSEFKLTHELPVVFSDAFASGIKSR